MKQILALLITIVMAILSLTGCKNGFETPTTTTTTSPSEVITEAPEQDSDHSETITTEKETTSATQGSTKKEEPSNNHFSLSDISEYSGKPYAVVNNNKPFFQKDEISKNSFEYYSPLDSLGRCGVTLACIGQDIMPTEDRGEIGQVKPTGWHTVKYDCVDGKYLYNRCHLIGYQLTGENANTRNLITGTRYMNVDGMLPFENKVDDYIEETNNHVMYRVTPIFEGDNLLATGVLMEAYSVEDNGALSFNVFCYNVQPGVSIDYETGDSSLSSTVTTTQPSESQEYVLNTSSKKFHYPSCSSVDDMKESNKKEFTGTRDELINDGYSPCGYCKP